MKHHFIDHYSSINSPIHSINVSVKLITSFLLVLSIVLLFSLETEKLLLCLGFLTLLIAISHIPARYFLRNIVILLPFIFLAGISILFQQGGEKIVSFGPLEIYRESFDKFITLVVRSIFSVSILQLLIATTPYSEILKALEKFRVPSLIVSLLGFIYRYSFIIYDEFMRAKIAASSRGRLNLKVWSYIVSSTLLRSLERSRKIYLSMKARGFEGRIRTLNYTRYSQIDVAATLVTMIFMVLLWKS